jgi:hypothetical protein
LKHKLLKPYEYFFGSNGEKEKTRFGIAITKCINHKDFHYLTSIPEAQQSTVIRNETADHQNLSFDNYDSSTPNGEKSSNGTKPAFKFQGLDFMLFRSRLTDINACQKKGQSWCRALFQIDEGLYHLKKKKKRIGINLIPAIISQ